MAMTNRQKLAYLKKQAKYWAKRLNFDSKYDIEVVRASQEAEEPDGLENEPLPQGLQLEEQIVTQIERSLLGETVWKKTNKIQKKYRGPGALMDFDDSRAQYYRIRIRVHSGTFLIPEDADFKLVANAAMMHEMFHGVLYPLSSYIRHLEEK